MSYNAEYQAIFLAQPYGVSTSSDDIIETLSFFDSWEDRYRYVIDLGKSLGSMPEEKRTADFIVHGCQSQVWIDYYLDDAGHLYFIADSDAHIVRGLAAIILAAFSNKTPEQIQAFDVDAYFNTLDLIRHISSTRGNGLRAMVGKIKAIADRVA